MTEKATVYVPQTEKYVKKPSTREYVTTAMPDDEPGSGPLNNPLFKHFIDEHAYAEALSGVVVQCIDVMIYNPETGKVLVGTRDQEPHAGDWVFGGRMRAGETAAQTASKNMRRELGIDLDTDRLTEAGNYKLVWDTKAQGSLPVWDNPAIMGKIPGYKDGSKIIGHSKGCHMSSTLEVYTLDHDEIGTIDDKLSHNEEYSQVHWVDPFDILDAEEGAYHPAFVDMVRDSLDVVTTPEPATTYKEKRLRTVGHLARLKSELAELDARHSEYQKIDNALHDSIAKRTV